MVVVTDTASVTDFTALINNLTTVAIPAFIALGVAIMNAVNHFTHSKRTEDLAKRTADIGAKVDVYLAKQTPNIDTAIGIGAGMSPAISNAIVSTHPAVIELQGKVDGMQNQLKIIVDFLNKLQADKPATATTVTTTPGLVTQTDSK